MVDNFSYDDVSLLHLHLKDLQQGALHLTKRLVLEHSHQNTKSKREWQGGEGRGGEGRGGERRGGEE